MSKKRTRRSRSSTESNINWKLLGGIIGLGIIGLIALLIFTVTAPPTAAEPTPALDESVLALADYCESNPERCIAVGAADAPNTIVEVSDYGCSHCRSFNLTTGPALHEAYVSAGQLRWWMFPFALSDRTMPSAAALLCAAEQADDDLLLTFHETMFDLQETTAAHQPEGFSSVARNVGLEDVEAFDTCVASERYVDTVQLNRQAAEQVGINSTPSFFLNGVLLRGNRPLNDFVQQIESSANSN